MEFCSSFAAPRCCASFAAGSGSDHTAPAVDETLSGSPGDARRVFRLSLLRLSRTLTDVARAPAVTRFLAARALPARNCQMWEPRRDAHASPGNCHRRVDNRRGYRLRALPTEAT